MQAGVGGGGVWDQAEGRLVSFGHNQSHPLFSPGANSEAFYLYGVCLDSSAFANSVLSVHSLCSAGLAHVQGTRESLLGKSEIQSQFRLLIRDIVMSLIL